MLTRITGIEVKYMEYGFGNLIGFANALFEGVHGKKKSELWSMLWVSILALPVTMGKAPDPSDLRFPHL